MTKEILKNKKGETLVEILIYVAITSIVIGSFVSFALLINELRSKTHSIKKVQTSINETFKLLHYEIANCNSILEPYNKASSSRLILDIRNQIDNNTFEIIDGVVYFTVGMDDPIRITDNNVYVDKLSFTNLAEEAKKDVIFVEMESRYRYDYTKAFEFFSDENMIVVRKY